MQHAAPLQYGQVAVQLEVGDVGAVAVPLELLVGDQPLEDVVLFQAATEEGFLWLSAVAVVNSVISLCYYLNVIRQMYMVEPEEMTRFRVRLTVTGSWPSWWLASSSSGSTPAPSSRSSTT